MCIRCETREKARPSLAFSRVSKPHTHITYMLRQCTSIVYLLSWVGGAMFFFKAMHIDSISLHYTRNIVQLKSFYIKFDSKHLFYLYTSVDTEMCCPKGKCGCQYFILLTLKKKNHGHKGPGFF